VGRLAFEVTSSPELREQKKGEERGPKKVGLKSDQQSSQATSKTYLEVLVIAVLRLDERRAVYTSIENHNCHVDTCLTVTSTFPNTSARLALAVSKRT